MEIFFKNIDQIAWKGLNSCELKFIKRAGFAAVSEQALKNIEASFKIKSLVWLNLISPKKFFNNSYYYCWFSKNLV